ncbi:MAG: TolC family protein [Sedimentisphaerales bacterium]|nr:TolC family protein [Sedimentisphaerales bacterium]
MKQHSLRTVVQAVRLDSVLPVAIVVGGLAAALCGCTPAQHREKADKVAQKIIEKKQQEALGKTEPFTIERPSDTLRRRLIEEQGLPISSEASLGTDKLKPVAHWPDEKYPPQGSSPDADIPIEPNRPLAISLIDALQIGARNNPDYQSRKEDVFRSALSLDLAANTFRSIFDAGGDSRITTAVTGAGTATNVNTGASAGVDKTFWNGLSIGSAIAVDLLNLLTQGGASAMGLSLDTSVSLPLLRGSGRHIVREPLTQAERNVIYSLWDFDRYRRTFAVSVAQDYYAVLGQMDSVNNARDNYSSAIRSARWSRRQADAGRIPEIQVDQAVQRELSGRNQWVSAQERLKTRLDSFKTGTLGLPADALIELDPNDMLQLRQRAEEYVTTMREASRSGVVQAVPPADAEVVLVPPSKEEAGPYEIDEEVAVRLALENRLDLRAANGAVYDAQRKVVVAADALRADVTVGGSAGFGGAPGRATDDDVSLDFDKGTYAALLSVDLPIERTRERNAYRTSLIDLERATRSVQDLEDQIKLSIRSELRTLLESRESLKIQAQSVVVAEKRVNSAQLFLEAGRAQIRDLLEAQDALLSARNQLTSAVVNYRTAELQFQRDLDLLKMTREGLWQELSPEELKDGV